MGKTEVENLDSKSILSNLSGIIANAKKEIESLKTEINDAKSDDEMIKKNLISVSNEFIENKKGSLKVKDSVVNISNDILAKKKNDNQINIKNPRHIIDNDTSIYETNRFKLKNMIRENIDSVKKIKKINIALKKTSIAFQVILKN